MCAPAVAGIASVASGAMGAVGSYQQGQSANASAIANYKYQLKVRENDWMMKMNEWNYKRSLYKRTVRENTDAARRGYEAEQTRLNEQFMQAAFQKQGMLTELMRSQGALGERQGNTAAKLNQSLLANFGSNNATIAANLTSARGAMQQRNLDIRRSLQSANNQAFSQVALRPQAGIAPPPPQLSNPGIGLAAGLLGSVASGLGTYNSLKAPPAFGGGGISATPSWGGAGNFQPNTTISGINYTPFA